MKKILLLGLFGLVGMIGSISRIHAGSYHSMLEPSDIQVLQRWLSLEHDREAIGALLADVLGNNHDLVLGSDLENKIEHWDYDLRTALALPSLMQVDNYRPFIFLLADLQRVDELYEKINKYTQYVQCNSKKTLSALKKYRAQVIKIFEYAVSLGVDIEAEDQWGKTALIAAIHSHKLDYVKLCLKAGADVNHPGVAERKQTPLMHALGMIDIGCWHTCAIFDIQSGLFQNSIEIVKVLVAAGAQSSLQQGLIEYIHTLERCLSQTIDEAIERCAYGDLREKYSFDVDFLENFDVDAFKAYVHINYQELIVYTTLNYARR